MKLLSALIAATLMFTSPTYACKEGKQSRKTASASYKNKKMKKTKHKISKKEKKKSKKIAKKQKKSKRMTSSDYDF
jgi:hypothetical protein